MKLDRRTSWAVVVALASALAGCADEDRPPASESSPISSVSLGGSGSSDTASSTDETSTPTTEPGPCEPFSHRDCKIYYRDDSGQLQCPTNVQFCDADGALWLECGDYTLDENGELQRIH